MLEIRRTSQFSRIDENPIRYGLYKELSAIRRCDRSASASSERRWRLRDAWLYHRSVGANARIEGLPKRTKRQTGTITVRRDDDGADFVLQVISTFRQIREGGVVQEIEDRLKDVASPDGRSVYTRDGVQFLFADEPDRPMQIVKNDRG